MCATPSAITEAYITEFARTYAGPNGWRGTAGLYWSMLREGDDIKALVNSGSLIAPILAVGGGGSTLTFDTME